jgi:hypothetical protein
MPIKLRSSGRPGVVKFTGITPFAPNLVSDLILWLKADSGAYSTEKDGSSFLCSENDEIMLWKDSSGQKNDAINENALLCPTLKIHEDGARSLFFGDASKSFQFLKIDNLLGRNVPTTKGPGGFLPGQNGQDVEMTAFVVWDASKQNKGPACELLGQSFIVNEDEKACYSDVNQIEQSEIYKYSERIIQEIVMKKSKKYNGLDSVVDKLLYINGVYQSCLLDGPGFDSGYFRYYVGYDPGRREKINLKIGRKENSKKNPSERPENVYEIIFYNRALHDKERAYVENYLKQKYKII